MPCSLTPTGSTHPCRSVWVLLASVTLNTSPPAYSSFKEALIYGAQCASGSAVSLVAYMVPCVRFISLLPASMQHSVGVDGWSLPRGDLHPARSAKLSLAHVTVEPPVARRPPHRSRRAELSHRALREYSHPHKSQDHLNCIWFVVCCVTLGFSTL